MKLHDYQKGTKNSYTHDCGKKQKYDYKNQAGGQLNLEHCTKSCTI